MNDNADAARIYHADLYGLRQEKYDWLNGHDRASAEIDERYPAVEGAVLDLG